MNFEDFDDQEIYEKDDFGDIYNAKDPPTRCANGSNYDLYHTKSAGKMGHISQKSNMRDYFSKNLQSPLSGSTNSVLTAKNYNFLENADSIQAYINSIQPIRLVHQAITEPSFSASATAQNKYISGSELQHFQYLLKTKTLIPCTPNTQAYLNIIFIPKKDGRVRCVVDGTEAIKRGVQFLRSTERIACSDVLIQAAQRNSEYYAQIDLSNGYYNCVLARPDPHLTVRINGRVYAFLKPPQGICNAPIICSRIFRTAFVHAGCFSSYIDNGLLIATSEKKIKKKIGTAIAKLTELGFAINHDDTRFGRSIPFLGMILTARCLTPSAESLRKFKESMGNKYAGYKAYYNDIVGNPDKKPIYYSDDLRIYINGAKNLGSAAILYNIHTKYISDIRITIHIQGSQQSTERQAILNGMYLGKKYNIYNIYTDAESIINNKQETFSKSNVLNSVLTHHGFRLSFVRRSDNPADPFSRYKAEFKNNG